MVPKLYNRRLQQQKCLISRIKARKNNHTTRGRLARAAERYSNAIRLNDAAVCLGILRCPPCGDDHTVISGATCLVNSENGDELKGATGRASMTIVGTKL